MKQLFTTLIEKQIKSIFIVNSFLTFKLNFWKCRFFWQKKCLKQNHQFIGIFSSVSTIYHSTNGIYSIKAIRFLLFTKFWWLQIFLILMKKEHPLSLDFSPIKRKYCPENETDCSIILLHSFFKFSLLHFSSLNCANLMKFIVCPWRKYMVYLGKTKNLILVIILEIVIIDRLKNVKKWENGRKIETNDNKCFSIFGRLYFFFFWNFEAILCEFPSKNDQIKPNSVLATHKVTPIDTHKDFFTAYLFSILKVHLHSSSLLIYLLILDCVKKNKCGLVLSLTFQWIWVSDPPQSET